MNSDQYTDLCELYALGALDPEERVEFEGHLAGCRDCRDGLKQAVQLNELILSVAPRVEPSPQLRRRVLAGFEKPVKDWSRIFAWTFALAAAAALILAFAWNAERQARLADNIELARLREIEQILQAPATKQVTFGPQPAAPHGSIFVHDKLGMILIADGLPAPPAGWTYESWVVPKDGAPQPIEAFRAPDGRGISLLRTPLPMDQLKAVAVSLEPTNTPITKPTKLVFAAPLG
jgi:Anti-sigma-K factor rskA/Putative zinc-finger